MSDPEFNFRECPRCSGYGVRDSGANGRTCGGRGRAGSRTGGLGSGEIIIETATGRVVPPGEFAKRVVARNASSPGGSLGGSDPETR